MEEGRPRQALPLAREAVDIGPDFYNGRVTLAWALHSMGQWREAIEQANWVLMRTPLNTEVRLFAANALLEVGDYGPATQNAAAAIAAGTRSPDARRIFVRALARVLRSHELGGLAPRAANISRSAGLDPASVLPELAAELRSLGASKHSTALMGQNSGR